MVRIFHARCFRCVQPEFQLCDIGINGAAFPPPDAVHGQMQLVFPALDGADTAIEIVSDFFPRIEDLERGSFILARYGAPREDGCRLEFLEL